MPLHKVVLGGWKRSASCNFRDGILELKLSHMRRSGCDYYELYGWHCCGRNMNGQVISRNDIQEWYPSSGVKKEVVIRALNQDRTVFLCSNCGFRKGVGWSPVTALLDEEAFEKIVRELDLAASCSWSGSDMGYDDAGAPRDHTGKIG